MKNELTDEQILACRTWQTAGSTCHLDRIAFARAVIAAHEAARQTASEKRAPVQGYTPGIPWSLHLEAYDVYRKKYGSQEALIDLEGRGCRGGFGTRELDDFIPGWRERGSEITALKAEIAALKSDLQDYMDAANAEAHEVNRLNIEIAALRQIEHRYVFVRNGLCDYDNDTVEDAFIAAEVVGRYPTEAEFDAAIDAAIAKEKS